MKDVTVGLISSALFALVDHFILLLAPTWKIAGLFATFAIGVIIATKLNKSGFSGRIMSNVAIKGKMEGTIKNSEFSGDATPEIMSNNKVSKDAVYTIDNVKIKNVKK